MSVRVVARIRPLLKSELDKDVIVEVCPSSTTADATCVRIPNPRNEAENFSFDFGNVYSDQATQQQIFDDEVAPTVKHLFKGFDVTLFAYGVTGTGKTHTMRGGKSMAERGMIPRLLSGIYRRSRKIEKDSGGTTQVEVAMSYYEIYNDRVFDLFEAVDKRTPAGLPIRDNGGKTVVVGLTERPCTTLKEFESLYDQANVNRSTSATKLNAHSSRSHAVLCVKVTQTTGNEIRVSTASAIDLAGSEDNRRTDNSKERMVESASINRSLFVLAQCVEAISKKQSRIPYRESKMTRILSLGQNNGLTIMILNLAPVRSYHLDTLSSLNFANRTKKIEVNEIENLAMFREQPKPEHHTSAFSGPAIQRQPLRPKNFSANIVPKEPIAKTEKAVKTFAVFSDKSRPSLQRPNIMGGTDQRRESNKRASCEAVPTLSRPAKIMRPNEMTARRPMQPSSMTQESLEALIERKVNEKLAESAMSAVVPAASSKDLDVDIQTRLDALERRVGGQETERSEGLQYLLMAKQHQVRGEDSSALTMYQLALPFFPENEKLARKMLLLQEKLRKMAVEGRRSRHGEDVNEAPESPVSEQSSRRQARRKAQHEDEEEYHEEADEQVPSEDDDGFVFRKKARKPKVNNLLVFRDDGEDENREQRAIAPYAGDNTAEALAHALALNDDSVPTPRTKSLLRIINTRDVAQIKLLRGVGAKKAEAIVNCLCEMDDTNASDENQGIVRDLGQLGRLKGVGVKGVEKMRDGLVAIY